MTVELYRLPMIVVSSAHGVLWIAEEVRSIGANEEDKLSE